MVSYREIIRAYGHEHYSAERLVLRVIRAGLPGERESLFCRGSIMLIKTYN